MAKKTLTTQQTAKAMAEAHTDLTIFAAVVELMEGGLLSSDCQPDEFLLIRHAKAATQRAFRRYEQAEAVLSIKPQ